MENQYALMAMGFVNALSPMNIVIMIASVTMGIVIGCMPGLSAAMGVALLLPLTFGMEPSAGLIMLGGIYCGAIFGGSISAILFNIPGTPQAMITDEDYALSRVVRAVKEHKVTAASGKDLEIHAPERILIHGDQPKALIFAKKLRDAVESEGIKVMYSGDAH